MTWYATRTDRAILNKTKKKEHIVLSPDDPSAFVAAFMASIREC